MKIKLDDGAFEPIRAHSTDAGVDLRAMVDQTVPANGSAIFHTGVHIELPKNTCGIMVSKSGLNVKYGITSTGLIDEGYTGEIIAKLYNHSSIPYHVNAGDKITQLVILPLTYEPIDIVSDFGDGENTERGVKGFGSSGR